MGFGSDVLPDQQLHLVPDRECECVHLGGDHVGEIQGERELRGG